MTAPWHWNEARVRRALGLEGGGEAPIAGISTDTRALAPGELFVALRGERFDAHAFVQRAGEMGAAGAVVEQGAKGPEGLPLFEVPDTLVALGELARFRREALGVPVVALTGSSGKTTFKELLRAALGVRYRVHATRGNLNNRIGVPLTLLETPDEAGIVVLEMGTNEPGEIAELTRIAEPDAGVVTTVGEAHLERLGSLEGVLDEKLALLAGLRAGGRAFTGDRPAFLPDTARARHPGVRVSGFTPEADAALRGQLEDADAEGRRPFVFGGVRVVPGVPGRHGAELALLALAVAGAFGVPYTEAGRALEATRPTGMRGERRRIGGITLVADCYNANPQSVRAALEVLAALEPGRARIAVLGSMLELGEAGPKLHRELLGEALALPLTAVIAVGLFADAARALEARGVPGRPGGPVLEVAEDAAEAWVRLAPLLEGNELLLLKGSRGVALEEMIPWLEAAHGTPDDDGEGGEG